MRPHPVCWLAAAALSAAVAVPAAAEVRPLSDTFRVNQTNDFQQRNPVAAFAPSGAGLVVWENDQRGIRAQFHRLDGTPIGGQLTLVENEHLAGRTDGIVRYRKDPAVAFLPSGHFLLAWTEERAYQRVFTFIEHRDIHDEDIVIQRFDASGAPAGQRHRVNATEAGRQSVPKLAVLNGGGILVVWRSVTGEAFKIVARLVGTAGIARGPEVELSVNPMADHHAVAAGRNGFLVAWNEQVDGASDIAARLVDANGAADGPAFAVAAGPGGQLWPAVAAGTDGNYLVAYHSYITDRVNVHIHGQFISPRGAFLGQQLRISAPTGSQLVPAIAATRQGFLATWRESTQSGWGIRAVELDHLGARLGEEIVVTPDKLVKNYRTSVATDGKGGFLIPWETGFRGRLVIAARSLSQ